MRKMRVNLWKDHEYNYPMAYGFVPNMVTYLHDDNEVRPCMLVVPGGGYCLVSPTEGEIVAKKFYDKGYNAFVLTYTTNILMKEPLKLQPLKDVSRAIRLIRKNAKDYMVDEGKLVICGFSAGGHLSASICVHYEDIKEEDKELATISNRPDAAILSYPVITSGPMAHRGSFIALLGKDATKDELEYMSLEKHVTKNTPPCFLWHTATDGLVPPENSYYFVDGLKKHGVGYALHIFKDGHHGLSLADELWASGEHGEPYTMEQIYNIVEKVKTGEIVLEENEKARFLKDHDRSEGNNQVRIQEYPDEEVAIWPDLAERWLKKVLQI